jgi:hypothetical protein
VRHGITVLSHLLLLIDHVIVEEALISLEGAQYLLVIISLVR